MEKSQLNKFVFGAEENELFWRSTKMDKPSKNSEISKTGSAELFASEDWEILQRAIMGARRIVLNQSNLNGDRRIRATPQTGIQNQQNGSEAAK